MTQPNSYHKSASRQAPRDLAELCEASMREFWAVRFRAIEFDDLPPPIELPIRVNPPSAKPKLALLTKQEAAATPCKPPAKSRRASPFRESDLARALRAAAKAGVKVRVEIEAAKMTLVPIENEPDAAKADDNEVERWLGRHAHRS